MIVLGSEAAGRYGKGTSDGLARPVDHGAGPGAGNDRALVLGGGILFIAWQVGYLNGLRRRGISAVRGLQHRDLGPYPVEAHDAVHPAVMYSYRDAS